MLKSIKFSLPLVFVSIFLALRVSLYGLEPMVSAPVITEPTLLKSAQWTTSSRLLKQGERIEFRFFIPEGATPGQLEIFARYLEQAEPGSRFRGDGDLSWLDLVPSESIPLKFIDGKAKVTYEPATAGNYISRWQIGNETFYRYFAVIDDDWIVLRFSTHVFAEANPTLHATGIPLDHRLFADEFGPNPLFEKLLANHRYYGDSIIPALPDTPPNDMSGTPGPPPHYVAKAMTLEERVAFYGRKLDKVRQLLPDPGDARSVRVEVRHDLDPGYVETFTRLGINDHSGLWAASAKPWLGMPEFPYFSSRVDCRKSNQAQGGQVVAHQWDFCGSFHFLGPVSWHYAAGRGQWKKTEHCLREGIKEAANSTQMSGHPVFLFPLYDGLVPHDPYPGYPNTAFDKGFEDGSMFRFVERYLRLMAFELPKEYYLAYARSLDVADYYRRHFATTPRTIFSCRTDHLDDYDLWWTWARNPDLTAPTIPWDFPISSIIQKDRSNKTPLAREYILIEDQKRSIRFERNCPHPIWWFDYTQQKRGPEGSAIANTITPSVEIVQSNWNREDNRLSLRLKILTKETFPNYAIALWDLPKEFNTRTNPAKINTNGNECILVKNTNGECHLVLFFDLVPELILNITLNHP